MCAFTVFQHFRLAKGRASIIRLWGGALMIALILASGCREADPLTPPTPPTPPKPALAKALTFYAFAEDMPQSVLDAFAREFGVAVDYQPFQSPEEAQARIVSGKEYDLVLIEHQLFPALLEQRLLAPINFQHIPNFKNISVNFRDLAMDPGNRFSIPASYGTTGLIVRTDLVGTGLSRWADLWNPRYAGKIGLRAQPREIIGMTLCSLGYAFASEKPEELEAALKRLLELKPAATMLAIEADHAVRLLLDGKIAVLHGYAEDYLEAHERNPAVAYVLPQEGTALWGESYAIAANSRRQYTAEVFLNFLLRPDITAQIIKEKKYAQPNDAALALIDPELRGNAVVFPANQDLKNGMLIQPLSPQGQHLYTDVWARFMAAHH